MHSPTAVRFGYYFFEKKRRFFTMTKEIMLHHKTFGKLIQNENITENGLYVYLCLKPLVNNHFTYLPMNVVKLNSVFSNADISTKKKQQDYIKTGLQELTQVNLTKIISNNKNNYELDLDGMVEKYSKDNPYTVFPVDAFRQALEDCHNRKTIFKCLSGFFYELTHNKITANTDGSEMYYFNATREELAEICRIDVRSLDKYLDILQKNKIIYIYKYNYKYCDSGKQLTNAYGLYKNKDEIEKRCNQYLDGLKKENKVYQSIIPRGKDSKKLMEEAKEAQYSPIEEATDKELAEHDKRHKELYAKRMAKKMEKEKTVVAESVPMKEVEEVVQADRKKETVQADDNKVIDFETIIAERKAENETILSDNNKKETVQADRKHKITIEEFERMWNNKPIQKVEKKKIEKVVEPVETHRVDRDEEYNVLMSELKLNSDTTFDKASKMFDILLLEKFGFVNEDDDDDALKERFKNEWDNEHKEKEKEHKEKEKEPFDDDDEIDEDNPFA